MSSPIEQEPVKNLQEKLSKDSDLKREYIENSYSSDDEENSFSSSEEDNFQESCRVMIPKKKRKKRHSTDFLLHELISQQKTYMIAQKKVMKLKSQIDIDEVRTRYIKLDLNNVQVEASELKEKLKKLEKSHLYSKVENWVSRVLFIALLALVTLNRSE